MNWIIFYLIGVMLSFVLTITAMHRKVFDAYIGAFLISLVSWIGIATAIGQIHYRVWKDSSNAK